ncbi:Hypothetical protein A7982_07194 [Minicystis rosea]|nr:Hypothetical protein A7982_07194 [Minicystis rosea]
MTEARASIFGSPGAGRIARLTLLALVVLAVSIRMYLAFVPAPTHRVLDPWNILAGGSLAPNQYRVLAPLLCALLKPLVGGAHEADELVQILAILGCNTALVALLLRETGKLELACVGLVAFFGAAANTMAWRNRETFLEALFALIGFALVVRPRPRWVAFAFVSVLGTLNRETWAFVLFAAVASRVAAAGGLRRLPRADVIGLASAAALALATFVGVRAHFGLRPYHTEVWMMGTNISNIALWREPDLVLAKGIWTLGSGLGLAYLLSLSHGARRHLPFVIGFAVPALVVSFFLASWFEPRIFTALYPLLIIALLGAASPAEAEAAPKAA